MLVWNSWCYVKARTKANWWSKAPSTSPDLPASSWGSWRTWQTTKWTEVPLNEKTGSVTKNLWFCLTVWTSLSIFGECILFMKIQKSTPKTFTFIYGSSNFKLVPSVFQCIQKLSCRFTRTAAAAAKAAAVVPGKSHPSPVEDANFACKGDPNVAPEGDANGCV